MSVRRMTRLTAGMTAIAAMTALAACGNGDDAEDNGDNGDGEVETGDEGDFIDDLEFATGGTGGAYYPLGGDLSTIFENETDATVNYVESGGSVDNLGRILQETAQLGLSQNDTAASAVNGELDISDDDEDEELIAVDNFGWIANLYPEAMHIVVRDDAGIDSIEDLDGATIAVGDVGSGTRAISDAILDHYEIDYTAEETEFGDSTEMLADGQIDASMFVVGVPVGSLTELAQSTDTSLLSLPDEEAEEIAEGGLYRPTPSTPTRTTSLRKTSQPSPSSRRWWPPPRRSVRISPTTSRPHCSTTSTTCPWPRVRASTSTRRFSASVTSRCTPALSATSTSRASRWKTATIPLGTPMRTLKLTRMSESRLPNSD